MLLDTTRFPLVFMRAADMEPLMDSPKLAGLRGPPGRRS